MRRLRVLTTGLLAVAGIVTIAGCGGSSSAIAVVVRSAQNQGIPDALVSVAGAGLHGRADAQGNVVLAGLKAGVYDVTASAPGYYATESQLQLAAGDPVTVYLTYRPPVGTFVWNIGPNGTYWAAATITATNVRSTEYEWTLPAESNEQKRRALEDLPRPDAGGHRAREDRATVGTRELPWRGSADAPRRLSFRRLVT